MIHIGWKHTGEKNKIWPKRKKYSIINWNTICCSFKKNSRFFSIFSDFISIFQKFFMSGKLPKIAAQYEPRVFTRYFTPQLAHVHSRSESYFGSHREWILIFVTIQILEVLLIGESKFLTNQKCYPDLGCDASSVWNFCARFSDVTSRGNQWWRREMSVVCFSGKAGSFTSGNATLHLMRVSWHKGSAYAWQKLVCNDAKVRWLLASTTYTKPFSQVGKREEKTPLKLHCRLSFLPGYRKLEWTLAYKSCGTKERERARGLGTFVT